MLGALTQQQLADNLASYELKLSPEQTARIEEAGRPPAIYPFWHRAMWGVDRPTPAERLYLEGYRKTVLGNEAAPSGPHPGISSLTAGRRCQRWSAPGKHAHSRCRCSCQLLPYLVDGHQQLRCFGSLVLVQHFNTQWSVCGKVVRNV